MRETKQKWLSFLGALLGSGIVVLAMVFMNELEGINRNKKKGTSTSFQVKAPQKKKSSAPKKIVKKRVKKSKPKVAPPSLASSLGGSSFGLDQFEFLGEGMDGLLSDSSNVVMTEDTVDEKPQASYRPQMEYPSSARKRGIEGHVTVNLLINTQGQVEKVKLLEGVPTGVFDLVAMNNVQNWQFEPARYKGKSVKIWVRQRISFNLN